MLEFLQVKNFALIKSLSLNFSQGCHIFTGETGAGKSILLNSIKALLAYKVSSNIVHPEAESAEVSASFSFKHCPEVAHKIFLILKSFELDWDLEEPLLIKRIWGKRNMVFVNDGISSLKVLKELSLSIIDYFSPGDQFQLLEPDKQRDFLDRFAQHKDLLNDTANAYETWQVAKQELYKFQQTRLNQQEFERLSIQVNELDTLNIQANEDKDLAKEYNQVYYARELLQNSQLAQEILSNDDSSIKKMLFKLQENLEVLEDKDTDNTKNIRDLLESILTDVNELSFEIDGYSSNLFVDEEKLHQLNQRMTDINEAKRKYGPSLEQLFSYQQEVLEKVEQYQSREKYQNELENELKKASNKYQELAKILSQSREESAKKFQDFVNKQFLDLSLNEALFTICLEESEPSILGVDCVEFKFASHRTLPLVPMREQASSGEIMRIVLALKVVLAEYEQVPVIIFDEIDSNVGGVTANKIAQKFNYLAKSCQLFCISHSPQIASCGKYHYKIIKESSENSIETLVIQLNKKQRIEEIMRMLGGRDLSVVSQQYVQELIDNLGQ